MSWFPKELQWMISCSYVMTPRKMQDVDRGFGTNMAFLKELVINAGMFDTNFGIKENKWIGGEDTKMFFNIKKYGKRVIFNPNTIVYHKIYSSRIKFSNIAKRSFSGGLSVAFMKNLLSYNVKNSMEDKYLNHLFFKFYPKSFTKLFNQPSKNIVKQIAAVSLVILCEGSGYLYGSFITTPS